MKNLTRKMLAGALIISGQAFAQDLKEVLIEDFDDNSLSWDIDNESGYSSNISNGKYTIKNSANKGLYWANTYEYKIDDADFIVETQITFKKINGEFNFYTHFIDFDSPFYGFSINGNYAKATYFRGDVYANGGPYAKKIENADFSKNGNSINFKIVSKLKDDGMSKTQELTFYINGQEIAKDINGHLSDDMTKFGYSLSNNTEIEVDYLKIYGTPMKEEVTSTMEISTSKLGSSASGSVGKTIKAGDPIFGKIFLPTSFYDLVQGNSYKIAISEIVYVNDEKVSIYEWTMGSSDISAQGNTFEVEMAPAIPNIKYAQEAYVLTRKLIDLKPGVHNIKLAVAYQKVGLSMANTLGEVDFKFDNTSATGREKFKSMVEAYRAQALKNVKLPEAKMTNSAVEASIKTAIIDANWVQTPIKVVIMESAWSTVTDKFYGNILQRQINVAVVVKDNNGFCTIFYPSVYQEYQGDGKYSSVTTLGGMHKLEQDIACENVN